ncbi:MAG: hypothetical protein QM718_05165 [Steroidobacteraceae bacterium]
MSALKISAAVAFSLVGCGALSLALAAPIDTTKVTKLDVGPLTPYGETPAESAAKRVAFEWVYTMMIQNKPEEAFARYVSTDFCDWAMASLTRGCGNAQQALNGMARMYKTPPKPGELREVPTMASVNGDMVTMYGEGVDIFKVKNGKIVAHWDASPPAAIEIEAHAPGFTEWVTGERKGPPPNTGKPSPNAVKVSLQLLTAVNPGPTTPYGETPQEMANKRVVFEWNHMAMIEGKRKEAFERYVSHDFCDHSHMANRAQKECSSWDELANRASKPAQLGDVIEIPVMATVNGEMVTMYGAGVDIFRVKDGKITDHWDATAPTAITLGAHNRETTERSFKVKLGLLDESYGRGGANAGGGPPQPAPGQAR